MSNHFPFVILLFVLVTCNGFVANNGLSLRRGRSASSLVMAVRGKLLIVQNKGGGHGTIGKTALSSFKTNQSLN